MEASVSKPYLAEVKFHSKCKLYSRSRSKFVICGPAVMASSSTYDFVVEVDGIGRVVRGVSVDTTCEDIVSVLSKAAGKKSPQVLVEIWHGCARPVTLSERPLLLVSQWGRHRKQVKFALRDASLYAPGSTRPSREGYCVRSRALKRSGRYLRRFRRHIQNKLEVVKKIDSIVASASSSSEKEKKEVIKQKRNILLLSLENKLKHLRRQEDLLEQTREKLKLCHETSEEATEERHQTLSNIMSRLEQELKLRSNLHQLQSTKVWLVCISACVYSNMHVWVYISQSVFYNYLSLHSSVLYTIHIFQSLLLVKLFLLLQCLSYSTLDPGGAIRDISC